MKSAYVLELSVEPGGARRGELHVCSTLAHLRTLLAYEFAGDPLHRALAADLAVFYGERIGVWVVQRGAAVTFVDLHPFLRARVDGAPPVLLDDEAAIAALAEQREAEDRDFVDEAEFDIDWRGIENAIPRLEGDILAAGEPLEHDGKAIPADELAWGWNDIENGDDAPDGYPQLT